MAQNYTRQSSFSDGDTITAALFNNEYNQLVNAFAYSSSSASSTGHRHDGSAGQGGNIFKIGDLDFLNKIEVDSTNNRLGFYVEVSSSAVEQIRVQDGALVPVTDSDVDIGTSSLYFKDAFIDSITTTGNVAVGGNLTVSGTTTTVDSTVVAIGDIAIALAKDNAGDVSDIGFYGKYVSSGTKYAGLFRDATDGVFKFYDSLTLEPNEGTGVVSVGSNGYSLGDLSTNLVSSNIDCGTF